MSEKKYDILLLGSTGYTGKLVFEYFCRNYNEEIKNGTLKLFVGVRNIERLKNIIRSFIEKNGEAEYSDIESKIHIDFVDVNDYNTVLNACMLSKVVINMTGPYTLYGYTVIRSSVEAGCHYVDVTGEHTFILKIFKEFNEAAKEKKLKIIHSAGFISALSDLGNFLLQKHCLEKYEKPCTYVRFRFTVNNTKYITVSKGTIKSAILFKKEIGNSYNKYYLCDGKYEECNSDDISCSVSKKKGCGFFSIDYEKEVGYCVPSVYSQIEETYVLWSNYLMNYKYGKNFTFDYKNFDPNTNIFAYIFNKIKEALFSYILSLRVSDYFLQRYINKSYEPKDPEELKKCCWKAVLIGELSREQNEQNEANTHLVYLYMNGQNEDPGYLLTAKIISETALTMLHNKEENGVYGVTTVSAGLGNSVIERLKKASVNMNVELS